MLGYCRVSTGEQAEAKQPISTQRERLAAYAAARGFVLELFVDEGVSGRKAIGDRPAGAELLAALRPGVAVAATSLDRLFRNAADALQRADDWRQTGVHLHVLDWHQQTVETETAHGWFMFSTFATVSELEGRRIAERTREGLRARKARGVVLGSAPYGWRREGVGELAKLVQVPEEQEGLALMRELRAQGLPYHEIARELTEREIPTKRGGAWFPATVRGILTRKPAKREE